MEAFVTALGLSVGGFLSQIAPIAPLIGIAIIVAFGLGILSAVIEGLGQGKATIAHRGRWDEGIDGIKSGKYHG